MKRRETDLLPQPNAKEPKSVTHVPGLNCHPSVRSNKGSALGALSEGRFFVAAVAPSP